MALSAYARAISDVQCPVLACRPVLTVWCQLSREDDCSSVEDKVPISLRACYAMSGTVIAYDAMALRAWHAMSGTDTARSILSPRACYAMSSTYHMALSIRYA
eukprot:1085378-Rhodomonas_salina.4